MSNITPISNSIEAFTFYVQHLLLCTKCHPYIVERVRDYKNNKYNLSMVRCYCQFIFVYGSSIVIRG